MVHAIFIGINAYRIRPLGGCINDALAMGAFFENLCKQQPQGQALPFSPKYLLEPETQAQKSFIESKVGTFQRPTRQNIIAAFSAWKKKVKAGDTCLFYYSGHGSMVPAPVEFSKTDPSGFLQTLVAVSETGGRADIVDKELAYLIADLLEPFTDIDGNCSVHFLSVMDCCHSGSNTRSGMLDIRPKMSPNQTEAPHITDLLGFSPKGNCFYPPLNGKTFTPHGLKHARYVSLAAAEDRETAKEMPFSESLVPSQVFEARHGAFTFAFLKTLAQVGTQLTYGELLQRVSLEIRTRVEEQSPVLGKTNLKDNHLYFLQNQLKTPEKRFEVQYHQQQGEWLMNGGQLHGVLPSSGAEKTVVGLSNGRKTIVRSVRSVESVLDGSAFTMQEQNDRSITATIETMARPTVRMAFNNDLDKAQIEAVLSLFEAESAQFPHIDLAEDANGAQYFIGTQEREGKSHFVLTKPNSDVPLFLQTSNALVFLQNADAVAKWTLSKSVNNPQTVIKREDFSIEVLVMENVEFGADDFEEKANNASLWKPTETNPDQVHLRFINDRQPAIKVRIRANNPRKSYYIGCLNLDCQFGIRSDFLEPQALGGQGGAPYLDLKFPAGNTDFSAIPMDMPEEFLALGVTEVEELLLFFISEKPFSLEEYAQNQLEMAKPEVKKRAGFASRRAMPKQDDWRTIPLPLTISRPLKAARLDGNRPVQFSTNGEGTSFQVSIQAPQGFAANAQWANRNTIGRATRNERSVGAAFLPPADMFDGVRTGEETFTRSTGAASGSQLNILELTNLQGAVSEEKPLLLRPNDALNQGESVIPFGFDAETGLFLPLGHTDATGQIVVERLPDETPYVIGQHGDDLVTERSFMGSVKLFFQKIVWNRLGENHALRTLALHRFEEGKQTTFSYSGEETADFQTFKNALQSGKTLLLVHGIIGDTEGMQTAFLHHEALRAKHDNILTFDYENLDSKIEDTAAALKEILEKLQLPQKSLTIVAHSMGGLVSRYFIEHLDGEQYVEKLIQLGTPNAGSDLSPLVQKVRGYASMAMNGVSVLKPYIQVFSFMYRLSGGDLFRTLDQMDSKSPFYAKLNHESKQPPQIPYYLVAGNTSIIEIAFPEFAGRIRRILLLLKGRGLYKVLDQAFGGIANDMAVNLDSMKTLASGNHKQIEEVACDHISYFDNEKSLKELLGFLGIEKDGQHG